MDTIEELVARLEQLSVSYYSGNPDVDDAVFDELEDKLKALDPDNPYFKKNRETPSAYGTKVNHIYEFIGSLPKIHSIAESKYAFKALDLSAKLDGTSLVTYFTNGKLDYAVTRGDGKQGVDVTAHYLAMTKKYGVTIPKNFTGAIRGEVVFSYDNWNKFKVLHPEAKYPRNSGTGLINQKEVQPVEEALLDYVLYDVVATSIPNVDHWKILSLFNIPLAPHCNSNGVTDEQLTKLYKAWGKIYPIDGIVIRVRSNETGSVVGKPGIYTYLTKLQEAYKFQAEVKEVTVNSITWQLGRTGKLTPVLNIEPTEMTGAIVSNITAHNVATVREMKLGAGAKVYAWRSGDVIPRIGGVVKSADKVEVPVLCPYCGTKLEETPTHKDIFCANPDCYGKRKFSVFNFIETMCHDVKGLGEVFLENFVDELVADDNLAISHFIWAARNHQNYTFNSLGNADNKVAKKVLDIIASDSYNAYDFWLSVGIKMLGEAAAKKFYYNETLTTAIIDNIAYDNIAELQNNLAQLLPGQVALASYIVAAQPMLKAIFFELNWGRPKFKFIYDLAEPVQYYAITGSLSKSRKEIQAEFLAKGWEMTDNLTKAKVLITNDPDSSSSKNLKAKQLKKEVMTEKNFRIIYLGEENLD